MPGKVIFTIGHSTRPVDEFKTILKRYNIQIVSDIRIMPGSRRNPQFNSDNLRESLETVGIEYTHIKELGGLRKPNKDSSNTGWRNPSFRGYADYMQSEEFEAGLSKLMKIAKDKTVVIMCAEAVPWRCHRSLVSDALIVRGFQIIDIFTESKSHPHSLTPWAKFEGGKLSYPSENASKVE
ncbi:MAG: DUF488 family protein [Nitrososphaerales archaeon]